MLELNNLGLNEIDLKDIIETNPEVTELSDDEIKNQIEILKQINCNNDTIKNIIVTNPFYLTRLDDDILKLINKLTSLGINNLNLLFNSNPHLLNKDAFEIDDFIKEQQTKYTFEEIVDMIDDNPYIIDEL